MASHPLGVSTAPLSLLVICKIADGGLYPTVSLMKILKVLHGICLCMVFIT